jgi:signal transduction histidine kinase/ActR/RegA family two-component response regulator
MSDAGRVESMAPPPSLLTHIGPIVPAHATVLRYAAAIGVVMVIFGVRALLAPLLGTQAPLLPFLLGVVVCAYLGGRGPAVLAAAVTPVLATVWFTGWPHDAPPVQWVAHVLFFLILSLLFIWMMHALQMTVRRADESKRAAETAATALRENDRRKDEFLAMLAHELRNPLTPIRNMAHILCRMPQDPATVKRAGEMLERQASHLTHLVDDLLDVARITHRRIELKREVVRLEDVVALALEAVQPTLETRRQIVTITVTTPRVHVDGDVVRLCQVVTNLLTNASKYSPEDSRIRIVVGGDPVTAELSVQDEGQGIDAQSLPRLFELFMQGDRSLDRVQGGLGIGLTIVKHLVEMHGGTVEVLSGGLGKGSEFRIRLPRAVNYFVARPTRSEPETDVRRRRVLVVEDNVDSADSLRDLLQLDHHDVRLAHSGTEALSFLDDFAAEVVLLDVGLPRLDGYMVAHAIRAKYTPGAPRPRIIALTGYGTADDRAAALRSGFDHHLVKPVEPAQLLRLIAEKSLPISVREELS